MLGLKLASCGLLFMGVLTPSANACRVLQTPEKRIADAYAAEAELRVALVTVTEARHLSNPMTRRMQALFESYEAPWRVTASINQTVHGGDSPELVVFDRGWGAAACDDETPMPRPGDRWVIYYVADHEIGATKVILSYPLDTAKRVDPRLHGLGS